MASESIYYCSKLAIYEGVKSAFDTMKSHFASLYGNEPTHLPPTLASN
jgi:hypothetical protein